LKKLFLFSALTTGLLFSNSLLATTTCSAIPSNLVANCGFETGMLSGWTASPAGYLNQYYGVDTSDANSGTYGAYLAGQSGNVTLSQTLATAIGTTYYVTFDLAHPDPNYAPYTNSFSVSFSGKTLYSESVQVFDYTQFTFSCTATSASTLLQFAAFDPINFFSLDDVAVYPAPEPSTLALSVPFLLGGALAVTRRRKEVSA
jgi:hypothetical protein